MGRKSKANWEMKSGSSREKLTRVGHLEVKQANGEGDGAGRGQMSKTFLSWGSFIPALLRARGWCGMWGVCLPLGSEGCLAWAVWCRSQVMSGIKKVEENGSGQFWEPVWGGWYRRSVLLKGRVWGTGQKDCT